MVGRTPPPSVLFGLLRKLFERGGPSGFRKNIAHTRFVLGRLETSCFCRDWATMWRKRTREADFGRLLRVASGSNQ